MGGPRVGLTPDPRRLEILRDVLSSEPDGPWPHETYATDQQDPAESTHDRLVALELSRMRARDAAREILERERRGPLPPFDLGTLSEVLARPATPPNRVEGIVPWEAGTLLTAQRKTGKTTAVLNLARSLLTGEDFLGRFGVRQVEGLVTLLNFEVSGQQLARWANDVGVPADRLLLVNLRGRRNPLGSLDDREALATTLRARGVETIVCDPFGRAYTGTSQNDAGEVGAFLGQLDQFTRADVGAKDLILTAHAGWNGERTRGSTALEDWADSIITLTRDDSEDGTGDRYIRAIGRDVDLEEDRLAFHPETRLLSLVGSGSRRTARAGRHADELRVAVLEVVTQRPGASGAEVERQLRDRGVPFQKGQERKALSSLVESGELRCEVGPRSSRLHFLAAPSPTLPTPPHGDTGDPPHPPLYGGGGSGVPQASHPPQLCEVCGQIMAVVEPGQTTHPGCGR